MSKTFPLCILALAAGLSAQATSSPDAARARVVRVIPLRQWMAPTTPVEPPPLGSFLGFPNGSPGLSLLDQPQGRRLLDSSVMQQLLQVFLPELGTGELDVDLRFLDSSLLVLGNAEHVKRLEETVQTLTAAMTHPVQLRAALYRLPADRSVPVVVDHAGLGKATQGLDELWSSSGSCTAGAVTALGRSRTTPYVYDFDVEVAQKAEIGDPKIADLFEGVRIVVQPHVLTGSSDVVLFAQFAIGEQTQPLQTRVSGEKDVPTLDVPDIETASGVFSGRVHSGGALLVTLQGAERASDSMLLVLEAERQDAPGKGEPIGVLPVSALLTRSLQYPLTASMSTDSTLTLQPEERSDAEGLRDPSDLLGLLQSVTPQLDNAYVGVYGGHLVVHDTDGALAAATEVIEGLQETWLRTAAVTATTTMVPAPAGGEVFLSGPRAESAAAPQVLYRIAFPALIGRSHTVVRGHQTTAIRDYDVEIAQKASIADAIVQGVFSGVVVRAFVHPELAGTTADLTLDLAYMPQPVRRPTELRDCDRFVSEQRHAHFDRTTEVGAQVDFGEGPIVELAGRNFRTRQQVTVELR